MILNLLWFCSIYGDIFCNWNKFYYFFCYVCNVNNGEWVGICSVDIEIVFYIDGDVVSVNINGKFVFIVVVILCCEFV